ncbi:MAG: Sialic acid TRAP transporter permease protein SiaT [Synergistetes bacterium ADurb.Bin155]|jgi:tripartite ATP-independent transporter DctM subunit|nr:TRAP transporter large permease subunit [Synergistales bacterium]MBP8995243.1 TRAP transporter large permease subunit [Synergistales bacterium]NMD17983.1 TRAP transporter large permease subunit [Synergistaceae bacterium]OQB46216.1 MAG: Sialic acid TRAP transporter permease protein SiaT [Synergistetes bacterium ADurb.Bin155]
MELTASTYLIMLLGLLFGGLFLGFPMAFTLGGSAVLAALIYSGPGMLSFAASQLYSGMLSIGLISLPLFVFIACLFERSGIAEEMFECFRQWLAGVHGSVAMATVVVCTIIAAFSGVSTAGVVTMGIIALPLMLRYGYNKSIASGSIMAGGALAILIPPSVSFIVYGMLARVSIGKLFAGGIVPGLILALGYLVYINLRCRLNPELGPPVPVEDRVSFQEKVRMTRGLLVPFLLILSILGTILIGAASPSEAAAIGAGVALLCVAAKRKLTLALLWESCDRTFRICNMVMWIIVGAKLFATMFVTVGAADLIRQFFLNLNVTPLVMVMIMQMTYIIMGCVTEEITMMCLTLPIYAPILASYGFDPVWFGVLFMINMQIGYLSPPFGYCLFYLKGVAPPEITTMDLYRSVWPFILIQIAVVLLVIFFPQLTLWLPSNVLGLR